MKIFYDFKMARFTKAIYMAIFITLALMNTSCGGSSSELEQQATITSLEATNTALELAILQATVSAGANAGGSVETSTEATPVPDAQPTSTAEVIQTGNNNTEADNDTEISLPAAAPIVPDDALFFEDFSNNDNGWSLAAKDNGSARIARQSLVLSANERDCIIVTIPSFTVEDQYYIQSDIKIEQPYDIVGYAFGNAPNQFYKYGIGHFNGFPSWGVVSYSPNGDRLSVTESQNALWQGNETFTLGMEVTSGLYTLYLNGESLESAQFSPEGNNIGLFVCNTLHESQAGFDNITIRESR